VDFGYDARTEELRDKLLAFMESHVYPAEQIFAEQVAAAEAARDIWHRPAVIDELKAEARRQGLWNLFLTVRRHKDQIGEIAEKHGAGPTSLEYAPLAEITRPGGTIAPEALVCLSRHRQY
jgi:acyl-CoA dehydrogenase